MIEKPIGVPMPAIVNKVIKQRPSSKLMDFNYPLIQKIYLCQVDLISLGLLASRYIE